ncbi:MAG: hypothetical protein AAGD05_01645 [Bacteroidota bacterium]
MLALGFTNIVFFSYLSYLILERRRLVYKSGLFWLMLAGFLLSLYLTMHFLNIPVAPFQLMP